MKQCPNCNHDVADFVTACPYCGAQIGAAPVDPAQVAYAGIPESSGKATASLVCGIATFLCIWPACIAAIILGHLALSDIKKSAGRMAGHGKAVAGLVLGYVGVGLIPFILIIAAIAIPNILRARMAANEASAVGSLRTYNTAMVSYAGACPDIGYPKSLENLGPGGKDCNHADLVETQMAVATPAKLGYRFYYMPKPGANGTLTTYVLAADPVTPGTTGQRHFFTDETGVIRASTNGGAADANSEPLQ